MAFPFSSKTVGFLIDAIVSGQTGTSMATLFLKAELDRWEPDSYSNKGPHATNLGWMVTTRSTQIR